MYMVPTDIAKKITYIQIFLIDSKLNTVHSVAMSLK